MNTPDPTFGSGAVKITGAHDFNDYQVAKRCGLPLYRLMDTRANMRADGGASYAEAVARAREIAAGGQRHPRQRSTRSTSCRKNTAAWHATPPAKR